MAVRVFLGTAGYPPSTGRVAMEFGGAEQHLTGASTPRCVGSDRTACPRDGSMSPPHTSISRPTESDRAALMPDDTRACAALHTFVVDLRAAFERAGQPTYDRLEQLSEGCNDPGRADGRRFRVLPHSTTHDILSGKRDKLPPWPWVSSFLHVLRVAATENGLDPDAIGATRDWHNRYLAARSATVAAPPPDEPLAAPVPEDADEEVAIAGDPRSPGTDGHEPPATMQPMEQYTLQRRYVDAYGRTGMRLLRHAEADEGKDQGVPAYRLATLLACENRPHEALYWLQ